MRFEKKKRQMAPEDACWIALFGFGFVFCFGLFSFWHDDSTDLQQLKTVRIRQPTRCRQTATRTPTTATIHPRVGPNTSTTTNNRDKDTHRNAVQSSSSHCPYTPLTYLHSRPTYKPNLIPLSFSLISQSPLAASSS